MRPSAANSLMNHHESSEKSDDEDHLSNDVHVNDDEEDSDNSYELIEYQCHICKLQLPNKDDLFDYEVLFMVCFNMVK